MNLNKYQRLAMRTSPDGHDRIKNGCLGVIGESGEIVDVIKKWMLVRLCRLIGTTIEHAAEANIEKLKKRYPDGFDPERSMNRPEYQHKEQTESVPGFLFNQRNKTV